jgi:hypothetical protein
MSAKLEGAREFWNESVATLNKGQWKEEQRTRCDPASHTDGVAAAIDASGTIRILTRLGGGEDSYYQHRYFFGEKGEIRLIFVTRADVEGGADEHVVFFSPTGTVLACDLLVLKVGAARPDLCGDETPEPALDPEVKRALRDNGPHVQHNEYREYLQHIRASEVFAECRP